MDTNECEHNWDNGDIIVVWQWQMVGRVLDGIICECEYALTVIKYECFWALQIEDRGRDVTHVSIDVLGWEG